MIHQPHFLPWPPYIARVLLSELFVVLDDVLYRKNYFQNRTLLIDNQNRLVWFTLPVSKHPRCSINSTQLASNNIWLLNTRMKTLEQSYSKYPHFHKAWPDVKIFLESIVSNGRDNLSTITVDSILLIFSLLKLSAPTIRYSSDFNTVGLDRTERILKIIELTGKDTYLSGWGGGSNPAIHDVALLKKNGVTIKPMDQKIAKNIAVDFVRYGGASTLHWIFTKGPQYVSERLFKYSESLYSV